jgi:type IV pilus assembly protein PilB
MRNAVAENRQPAYAIIDELLNRGLVSAEAVSDAMRRAAQDKRTALKILLDERTVPESTVYQTVAETANMPFINPDDLVIDASASDRLPAEWARKLNALPFGWDGPVLRIAVDNPTNLTVADDLRRLAQSEVSLVLAPKTALTRKIGQVYRTDDELDDLTAVLGSEAQQAAAFAEASTGEGADGEAPIIRYVNLLIAQAVADRASDIHLEPTETDLEVRYRIDGVLHPQPTASKALLQPVVSRIKIMANMDIAERRIPQDGRMTVSISGRKVDLRVATLPTVYGEKVILRILDNASTPLDLADVGLSEYHQEVYKRHYRKPYGMILVTGPTGSGKSTTLYATLNTIRNKTINVITVEDPVEYRMAGVNQVQINNKAGLTFAAALRSILRADPDVVLVGEIRDAETAKIAVEASLTGHMVLSTLHTNDAASAVTRLVEMGVEPYLLGSALSCVVAQRLLRRLCERCAEPFTPEPDVLRAAGYPWEEGQPLPTLHRAVGCVACSRTGYRGRTAIHEMLEITPHIERMANGGAHTDQIQEAAVQDGMKLMRADGWEKVLAGETTLEEVLRVSA